MFTKMWYIVSPTVFSFACLFVVIWIMGICSWMTTFTTARFSLRLPAAIVTAFVFSPFDCKTHHHVGVTSEYCGWTDVFSKLNSASIFQLSPIDKSVSVYLQLPVANKSNHSGLKLRLQDKVV